MLVNRQFHSQQDYRCKEPCLAVVELFQKTRNNCFFPHIDLRVFFLVPWPYLLMSICGKVKTKPAEATCKITVSRKNFILELKHFRELGFIAMEIDDQF